MKSKLKIIIIFIGLLFGLKVNLEAQTVGIKIATPIIKNNPLDNTITGYANLLNGGWHITTTTAGRDSLTTQFSTTLETGMICYVIANATYYQWSGSSWVVTNFGIGNTIYTGSGSLAGNTNVTLSGHNLKFLGTNLEMDFFEGSSLYEVFLTGAGGFDILDATDYNSGYKTFAGVSSEIDFSATAMTVEDDINNKGLQEFADYSANYTASNYITKRYGDAHYGITGSFIQNQNSIVQTANARINGLFKSDDGAGNYALIGQAAVHAQTATGAMFDVAYADLGTPTGINISELDDDGDSNYSLSSSGLLFGLAAGGGATLSTTGLAFGSLNATISVPSTETLSIGATGAFLKFLGISSGTAVSGYGVNSSGQLITYTPGGGTGTVTTISGVAANGFTWSIANPTTTPAITLTLQNATTSQSGQLTSTDWNTFNGKFTLPSLTNHSVLFSNGTTISQDNNNFYYDGSSHILSVATNGDFTGTNAVNIYGQYDAYEPQSAIGGVTSATVFPGVTASTSRGTGTSPLVNNTGDYTGGFSGWGYTQASPQYTYMAGMAIKMVGSSASLGGQLELYTKADNATTTTAWEIIGNDGTITFAKYGTGLLHSGSTGIVSSSLVVNADINNSTIDLTAKVTGILPVANGGTGSGTQNFVDLTTNQTVAGNKNFSGTTTIATPFTLGATSVTSTGTQLNYLNAATGTTGTTSTNLVFSTSPSLVTPTLGVASLTQATFAAGTASVAPIVLTSGTDLTSAAAGSFEFNGTRLAFSPSTTRKRIVLTNDVAPTNGQIPIGNGTDYTAATLTGTLNEITVTNTSGVITLATPQPIATGSSPQFTRMGLGTAQNASTVLMITGGTTGVSQIRLNTGVAPTSPTTGDIWRVSGSQIQFYDGTLTNNIVMSQNSQVIILASSNTTLVAGTKAISVTGVTTGSHAFVNAVSQGGTVSTTFEYAAVCTSGTLTITALTTGNVTNTLDTSVVNYFITN